MPDTPQDEPDERRTLGASASRRSPLQNRVDPLGRIVATAERGALMGNRGGRLHDDAQTLRRQWASRRWIACRLTFRDRRRNVMGAGYTELFFMDEPTALAAGHRPCFECRRADANAFAAAWAKAKSLDGPPKADEMDAALHPERLDARRKRLHLAPLETLPNGALVLFQGSPWMVRDDCLLQWSYGGYVAAVPRMTGPAQVITPQSIVDVLRAGYAPASRFNPVRTNADGRVARRRWREV